MYGVGDQCKGGSAWRPECPPAAASAVPPITSTMGLWECDLLTQSLRWSDGVYDLFGLPRGSALDRDTVAARYVRYSRVELELARLEAIRDCRGFLLDAEITVPGGTRWIRIVAQTEAMEGMAVRLFGSKHDVTFERTLWTAQGRSVDIKPNAVPPMPPRSGPGSAALLR